MATFFKRYCSDLLVLLGCLGFGLFVLSEARAGKNTSGPWASSSPIPMVALAGR